ncbi:MAPEG family protein [Nocardioides sp.]|uniref:MAPEG family protein n=1 Tax=Nocardioides sp. TaxID=35761 RepID=UPI0035B1E4B4
MPTDPADRLLIAQRAHGNATEYVPTLIGLLIVCSTLTDGWWLDVLAVAATTARVVHAYGMLRATSLADHGPVRDTGALLTYVTGLALGVTAVLAV